MTNSANMISVSTPLPSELFAASQAGEVDAFRQVVERYQNLVCAVAYSRTGDRQLSEDIGQDTFLAAWKSLDSVKQPDHLGSWLCGIARNLSGKALRKRRPNVVTDDSLETRASNAPGPLEAIIEDESERLVWQTLEGLPEKLREPLVLFYREERSVREVASGLGISEDAAKKRLSRGRTALKAGVSDLVEKTLSASRPGKQFTAAVVASIVAYVAAGASAASASAGSGSASSSGKASGAAKSLATMKGASIAVLIAAVTGVGGIAVYQVVRASGAETANTPAQAADEALYQKLEAHRREIGAALATKRCELRGTVRANGEAVPGATVTIQSVASHREAVGPIELSTDADGSWSLTTSRGAHWVAVNGKGFLAATERADCASEGAMTVSIELAAGGLSLTGTVRDLGGGPVGGATIVAMSDGDGESPKIARSGEDGSFSLNLPPQRYSLSVQHSEYAVARRWFALVRDRSGEDFALLPGATIEGIVLDAETNEPVAGAYVRTRRAGLTAFQFQRSSAASITSARVPVQADERGRFRMTGISEGAVELVASSGRHSMPIPLRVDLGVGATRADIVLRLEATPIVSGFVTSALEPGRGVAGAAVVIVELGGQRSSFQMPKIPDYALTDASGFFELGTSLTGAHRLVASTPNSAGGIDIQLDGSDTANIVVALDAGANVEGRLDPPGAAAITLEPKARTAATLGTTRQAHADSSGHFKLKNVAPGDYVVVAEAAEHLGQTTIRVGATPMTDVIVPVSPLVRISGRVIDERGEPVAAARVRASIPLGDSSKRRGRTAFPTDRSDPDGRFEIVGLEAGSYELRVLGDLDERPLLTDDNEVRDRRRRERLKVEAPSSDVELRVARSGWFATGVVRSPDESPLADVWVTTQGFRAADHGAFTDETGRFRLGPFHGKKANLIANAASRGQRSSAVYVTRADNDTIITVGPVTRVEATVTRDGKPVPDFEVAVDEGPTRVVGRLVSRRRGGFTLPSIVSGAYRIEVKSSEGVAAKTVVAGPGPTTHVAFELADTGTVRGVFIGKGGKPEAGATLSVSGAAVFRGEHISRLLGDGIAPTAADGSFAISGLMPGAGEIYFLGEHQTPIWTAGFVAESGMVVELGEVGPGATPPYRDQSRDLGLRFFVGPDAPSPADLRALDRSSDPLDLIEEDGAKLWIANVSPGGPAEEAGLSRGDHVIAVGAMVIGNGRSPLQAMASLSEPWRSRGRTIVWRIGRANAELNVDVRLEPK